MPRSVYNYLGYNSAGNMRLKIIVVSDCSDCPHFCWTRIPPYHCGKVVEHGGYVRLPNNLVTPKWCPLIDLHDPDCFDKMEKSIGTARTSIEYGEL